MEVLRRWGRRCLLSMLAGTLLLIALLYSFLAPNVSVATANPIEGTEPFRLVILPDTQKYRDGLEATFGAQTQWIADNQAALNIRFVIHEGDITDNNIASQWEVAREAMRRLDGIVPYSVLPGNHDMGTNGSADTRDTTFYNQYFPLTHYNGWPTFGGVFSEEPARYDNNYHTFSAAGTDWLVLSLEFGPRDDVLTWANQVVAGHPNHRVIVVTHTYLWSNETRQDESEAWDPHTYGVSNDPGGVNDGEEMWEKFIRKHANISFVLNGHVLNDGQGRLVSVGDHGNRVVQMLANFQMLPNGGDGYLRILEFDPANKTVSGVTYSPVLDATLTDWQNQFVFRDVELGPPGSSPADLLHHDNFEEGDLEHYTIVDEGMLAGPSIWEWTSGEIVQASNIYGPDIPATDHRQGTYAFYAAAEAMAWSDYRLEATIRSTDNDGIGLMFYYQDPSNYYKLDLDDQRNFYKLFRMLGGVETTLASVPGGYTTGDNLDVVVDMKAGSIRVFLDEVDIFGGPVVDESLAGGTFALYCWGNQNSIFDDIRVESLADPLTELWLPLLMAP